MAQVSKYLVSKDVYERIFDVFLRTITSLRTPGKASDFLEEFLTPTERIMLAKRLVIAFLLAKKYNYREISKILRVSMATIGSVSMKYRYGKKFRLVVDMIIEDEKMEKFWLEIGESIASVLSMGGTRVGGWRALKQELSQKRRKKEVL